MAVDILARGIASRKADLVNGKVPSSQLPSYVDDVVEVANYEALPNPGETGKIYITLDDNKTYRWGGSTYILIGSGDGYESVAITDIANMGALRTYIDGINALGKHCFFDFSAYISGAYVCTVQMYTVGSVNYCYIFDLLNHKIYGSLVGYNDSDTIQAYVTASGNNNDIPYILKITDVNTTLANVIADIDRVNALGHHIFIDVSALSTSDYLITFTYETLGTATRCIAHGLVKCNTTCVDYTTEELSTITLKSFLSQNNSIAAYSNKIISSGLVYQPSSYINSEHVAYANGIYVMISKSGNTAYYSYDAQSWIATELPETGSWSKIVHNGKSFIAVNCDNPLKSIVSSNGIDWKISTSSSYYNNSKTSGLFYYDGYTYMLPTKNSTRLVRTVQNGSTWNNYYTIPSQATACSVGFANSEHIILIADSRIYYASMPLSSSSEWTLGTMPLASVCAGVHGNNGYVLVGNSDKCAYSIDGITWSLYDMPSSRQWKSITYGNGYYVAVAYGYNYAAVSKDGKNWELQFISNQTVYSSYYDVAYGKGIFFGVCNASYSNVFNIKTSSYVTSNGKDISEAIANSIQDYITVLPSNKSIGDVLSYTSDGIVWKTSAGALLNYDRTIKSSTTTNIGTAITSPIVYGNGIYVMIGSDGYSYTSEDGLTWEASGTVTAGQYNCLTFAFGKFIAVRSSSTEVITSTDGVTWTSLALTTSATWSYIASSGSRVVVVGSNSTGGISYYTDDGNTWVEAYSAQTSKYPYDLVYWNGKFYAQYANSYGVIWNYQIFSSEDGINYTKTIIKSSSSGFYTSHHCIHRMGDGLCAKISDIVYYTTDGENWQDITQSYKYAFLDLSNAFFYSGLIATDGKVSYRFAGRSYNSGYYNIIYSFNGKDWYDSGYISPQTNSSSNNAGYATICNNRMFIVYASENYVYSYDLNNSITQQDIDVTEKVADLISPYLSIEVEGTSVKSTSVTSGQVLTADGDGTSSWTGSPTLEDVTADNVFANDEIEFINSTGDFGTNAKARIQAAAKQFTDAEATTLKSAVTNNGLGWTSGATDYKIDNKYIDLDSTPTASSSKPVTSGGTYTALSAKQDTLVSGTSIKTINSTSVLGSGDIAVQPTLVSGTNIKTINGTSVLGSGNIAVRTYQAFPSTFVTTGTVQQFVDSVLATSGVGEGMAYLGELECSDLPTTPRGQFGNIEATVSMITNSIMVIEITTGSDGYTPYMWKYNSALGRWTKWSDVIANPTGTASTTLSTLSIDGVIYSLPTKTIATKDNTVTTYALTNNECPKFTARTANLTLTLSTSVTDGNEYKAEIITSSTMTLTLPSSVSTTKTNDDAITISGTTVSLPASATVEISIWDGKAFIYNWSVTD